MKRDIHEKVKTLISRPGKTLIIEGARQVGKSFLIKQILAEIDKPYLSFDLEKDPVVRNHINRTRHFDEFKDLLTDRYNLPEQSVLFIDEAQECPQLARYVKSFTEDWHDVNVVLTGSSMKRFFPKKMRMPVGRTKSICVFPFDFHEFVRYTHSEELARFIAGAPTEVSPARHEYLLELFDRFIQVGGYPEAVKAFTTDEQYKDVTGEIVATLSEDFMRKEEYRPLQFDQALQAIANNVGFPSKYSHFDTTKHHAKKLIEALKAWHIVIEVEQLPLNPISGKYLPKRYLCDIGMLNLKRSAVLPRLSLLHTLDPLLRTSIGGLFENAVVLNLLQGRSAYQKVSTWKKDGSSSTEVDFIVELADNRTTVPVECKASLKLSQKHVGAVIQYLKITNQNIGMLISCAPLRRMQVADKTVINLPIYLASLSNIQTYSSMASTDSLPH